jgi:2-isopropylmalate synthase
VNSQSGKGGVAYLLETDYGLTLPRRLQVEFSQVVQDIADQSGKEITASQIWQAFNDEYLALQAPYEFVNHQTLPDSHASEVRNLTAVIRDKGREVTISGRGNGPIDAFMDALKRHSGIDLKVVDYREHSVGAGNDASAVAYLETKLPDGREVFGVGKDSNIVTASLKAILSATNRAATGKVRDIAG